MSNPNDPLATIQRMAAAFRLGDADALLETVHPESRWTSDGAGRAGPSPAPRLSADSLPSAPRGGGGLLVVVMVDLRGDVGVGCQWSVVLAAGVSLGIVIMIEMIAAMTIKRLTARATRAASRTATLSWRPR